MTWYQSILLATFVRKGGFKDDFVIFLVLSITITIEKNQ